MCQGRLPTPGFAKSDRSCRLTEFGVPLAAPFAASANSQNILARCCKLITALSSVSDELHFNQPSFWVTTYARCFQLCFPSSLHKPFFHGDNISRFILHLPLHYFCTILCPDS